MPARRKFKTAAQKKMERKKAADRKKHAMERRLKAEQESTVDLEEQNRIAKERRAKAAAYSEVQEQNLDLASEVYARMYIGKRENAESEEYLVDELGITHVLNAAMEIPIPDFYEPRGVQFCHLDMKDRTDFPIENFFEEGTDFIQAAYEVPGSKVFVHCREGRSRSSSMVAAWMIKYRSMRLEAAMATIVARRHLVHPNSGFMEKLRQWEAQYGPPDPNQLANQVDDMTLAEG